MTLSTPRAVIVRRNTEYDLLLARHATRGQAEFFLKSRDQDIREVETEHHLVQSVHKDLLRSIPQRWRRTEITREDLDRFLFEPEDVVIAIGQDGLVANISKYLDGQLVIGINPLPDRYDGVLSRITPQQSKGLLQTIDEHKSPEIEARTMVCATLDDSQSIYALNEIFIGHRTHQSARYRIRWNKNEERQSSSGVIIATGTGSTGWARSINQAYGSSLKLPSPTDNRLAFFVREAFPSIHTGTSLTMGISDQNNPIQITSEMNQGGVIFGDGIEDDALPFDWGQSLHIEIAKRTLNLVVG
ncbi:hypothetical protein COB72_01290 [bacterium]|nr:MAG: hypothetical protein COB72_01290 [bacterium]